MTDCKLVPVEPTGEMIKAGCGPTCGSPTMAVGAYKFMIAAAPTQPSPAESSPVAWMASSKNRAPVFFHDEKEAFLCCGSSEWTITPVYSNPAESDKEYPIANCYSDDDGDHWYDSPNDIGFVEGLAVGDEYELQASIYSWTERFRVVKAPDDTNDDYEVEPVLIRTSVKTKSDKEAVRNAALEEAAQQIDGATINQRILAKRIRALKSQPAQPSDTPSLSTGCARSHPHEDMNSECEALTVKARAENQAAQHQRLPSDAEILQWIFAQTKTDNGKTARENIAAAMRADRDGS